MAEEKKVKAAAPEAETVATEKFVPNFKQKYLKEVAPALFKEHGYTSVMQVPRLEKIVVSIGCGDAVENKKLLETAVKELETITGQHVVKTKARKSIANFKVREGQEIGAMVTLRGDNMWFFLERLICVALPRMKDFRGVNPNAFDGRGNYSLGITEQIVFPEIDFDKIERISGMNIAFVTTAPSDEEGYDLLAKLGMPFAKNAGK